VSVAIAQRRRCSSQQKSSTALLKEAFIHRDFKGAGKIAEEIAASRHEGIQAEKLCPVDFANLCVAFSRARSSSCAESLKSLVSYEEAQSYLQYLDENNNSPAKSQERQEQVNVPLGPPAEILSSLLSALNSRMHTEHMWRAHSEQEQAHLTRLMKVRR